MRRRDFIALVGSTLALRPLNARAQPAKTPVIGLLCGGTAETDADRLNPFTLHFSKLGRLKNQIAAIKKAWPARIPQSISRMSRARRPFVIRLFDTPILFEPGCNGCDIPHPTACSAHS
jgi:hypothetical protein